MSGTPLLVAGAGLRTALGLAFFLLAAGCSNEVALSVGDGGVPDGGVAGDAGNPFDAGQLPDASTQPDASVANCGDETCEPNEHCSLCPSDCGACNGTIPTVARGPYLQGGSPTRMIVRWRTEEATDSVVAYGPEQAELTSVAANSAMTTEHEVQLTNLETAARYYYAFGSSTAPLFGDAEQFFTTAPNSGTSQSTRIWVIGDSGTANDNARDVRDAYLGYTGSRGTDLWLMLGDNAYDDGRDDEYQRAVFEMYPELLRNTVLWPTLGNHERPDSPNQAGPYFDIFSLPTNGESGGVPSGTEAYYSYDYANMHFVVLDSYDTDRSTGGAMLTWLENDLAATALPWIIAYWHHPPYSKGSHDSDNSSRETDMRENVLPILESHGVDLVMSGHSHSYERSMLLDGHYDTSDTLNVSMIVDPGDGSENGDGAYRKPNAASPGAVYIVAGSSGKKSGGDLNHPAMHISLDELGSVVLDVDGPRMDAVFIDETGSVQDAFTVRKN